MVISQCAGQETLITLEPNRSATRRQTQWFVALVAGVTLLIAVFWAFWGAWMVLPFAGLEIAVLIYVALRVSRSTYRMQVIRITAMAVDVEEGESYPVRRWRFMRPDAYLSVADGETPMDAIRLRLQDGRQTLEIGVFLNQDDRQTLCHQLRAAGLMICHERWWRS